MWAYESVLYQIYPLGFYYSLTRFEIQIPFLIIVYPIISFILSLAWPAIYIPKIFKLVKCDKTYAHVVQTVQENTESNINVTIVLPPERSVK